MLTPEKLLQFFDGFDYGFMYNGKKCTGYDLDFLVYKTLTPQEVLKYRIGTCWDYTTVEYLLFKKYMPDITCQCFYVEAEDDTNHTWLAFYRDHSINIFEYSWYDLRGIHTFSTEAEMLNFYTIKFLAATSSFCRSIVVFKYIPPNKYHLSPDEFMYHVTNTGQFVNDMNRYHNSVIERNIKYEEKQFKKLIKSQ